MTLEPLLYLIFNCFKSVFDSFLALNLDAKWSHCIIIETIYASSVFKWIHYQVVQFFQSLHVGGLKIKQTERNFTKHVKFIPWLTLFLVIQLATPELHEKYCTIVDCVIQDRVPKMVDDAIAGTSWNRTLHKNRKNEINSQQLHFLPDFRSRWRIADEIKDVIEKKKTSSRSSQCLLHVRIQPPT